MGRIALTPIGVGKIYATIDSLMMATITLKVCTWEEFEHPITSYVVRSFNGEVLFKAMGTPLGLTQCEEFIKENIRDRYVEWRAFFPAWFNHNAHR